MAAGNGHVEAARYLGSEVGAIIIGVVNVIVIIIIVIASPSSSSSLASSSCSGACHQTETPAVRDSAAVSGSPASDRPTNYSCHGLIPTRTHAAMQLMFKTCKIWKGGSKAGTRLKVIQPKSLESTRHNGHTRHRACKCLGRTKSISVPTQHFTFSIIIVVTSIVVMIRNCKDAARPCTVSRAK